MASTRSVVVMRTIAAAALLAVAMAFAWTVHARTTSTVVAEIGVSSLPEEARRVLIAISAGGPFSAERDGVDFGNRERLLPPRARGYYHEYTVRAPGVRHRGARRIVCGGPVRTPDVCYYTADHYRSFARIRE
jgi:ribonuclease T1